jgi:hypothetical protein
MRFGQWCGALLLLLSLTPMVQADYELPDSLFGYKMILTSSLRNDNGESYIGFVQHQNLKPPFVLLVTKSFNMHQVKITSQVMDEKLVGKIFLPAGVTAEDIKELRINGYTILWKSAN